MIFYREQVEGAKEAHLEGMPSLYYVPENITVLGDVVEAEPTIDELISEYFIRHEDEYYGYFTGFISLNLIGGSTQVPSVIDIKSNKVDKETLFVFGYTKYIINKSEIEVNNANHSVLELLDDIEYLYDYFDEGLLDVPLVIKRCVKKLNLKMKNFKPYLGVYSARTNKVIKHIFTPWWCRLHYIKRRIENLDGRYNGW